MESTQHFTFSLLVVASPLCQSTRTQFRSSPNTCAGYRILARVPFTQIGIKDGHTTLHIQALLISTFISSMSNQLTSGVMDDLEAMYGHLYSGDGQDHLHQAVQEQPLHSGSYLEDSLGKQYFGGNTCVFNYIYYFKTILMRVVVFSRS